MRRVLILTYDFPPRGATAVFRVTKFVRYLPEFGWQPVVVTATVRGGMRDDALLAQLPPDLEVIRVDNPFAPASAETGAHSAQPSRKAQLRQQLRRLFIPDPQILWTPAAVRAAQTRLQRGDIAAFMTTAPPYSVHMAGLRLKRAVPHLPWLMDLRDIWSENPAITDLLTYKLQRAYERACVRTANHITTATDGQRRLVQQAFAVPDTRISTITNGFDPADFPPMSRAAPRTDSPLRITYLGTLIGARAAATRGLFEALTALTQHGITAADLQVRLIGLFDPQIYAWAAPLQTQGLVALMPFKPYAEAVVEMAVADVLLLITSDDREGRLSQPNKLFEYFATGKPILALTPEGDNAQLVRESGVGIAVQPNATTEIEQRLKELIAQHPTGTLPHLTNNDPRFQRFQRRELTRQLAARLDALTS